MTTPKSEQSAEERALEEVQSRYLAETGEATIVSHPRTGQEWWTDDFVAWLCLTNQRLTSEVERLEGEAADLLKMKERWAKVEEAYERDISTLRARIEDMKELEQALMLKESRIKELEAEVERMKELRRLAEELVNLDDSREAKRPVTGYEAEHLLIVESMRVRLRELSSKEQKGER